MATNRDYFVGTLAECQDYIAKMDTDLGYPNPATKTDTYALPAPHEVEKGVDGKDVYMVVVKGVYSHVEDKQLEDSDINLKSSENEKLKFKKQDVLKGEGAFDKDEKKEK